MHEDDSCIVHNALVLMTAKETINWMKQKGYLHHWLHPLNGLQDGTPYAGCPVGNIPEFMPLDNSLNRDILQSLRFHRHEPSWYDKEELPSLTSTQLVFFDEIHIQQMCGPPVTSSVN